jgi:hypothetical protein
MFNDTMSNVYKINARRHTVACISDYKHNIAGS